MYKLGNSLPVGKWHNIFSSKDAAILYFPSVEYNYMQIVIWYRFGYGSKLTISNYICLTYVNHRHVSY